MGVESSFQLRVALDVIFIVIHDVDADQDICTLSTVSISMNPESISAPSAKVACSSEYIILALFSR